LHLKDATKCIYLSTKPTNIFSRVSLHFNLVTTSYEYACAGRVTFTRFWHTYYSYNHFRSVQDVFNNVWVMMYWYSAIDCRFYVGCKVIYYSGQILIIKNNMHHRIRGHNWWRHQCTTHAYRNWFCPENNICLIICYAFMLY